MTALARAMFARPLAVVVVVAKGKAVLASVLMATKEAAVTNPVFGGGGEVEGTVVPGPG